MSDGIFAPTTDVVVDSVTGGNIAVTNFPVTQPVSGTVSIGGTVATTVASASTSSVTQVVLTNNTNATLLSSNASRKQAIIFVPSNNTFIKFGVTASSTSFTYKVAAANTTILTSGYTGQIDAFGPAQTINVTELS